MAPLLIVIPKRSFNSGHLALGWRSTRRRRRSIFRLSGADMRPAFFGAGASSQGHGSCGTPIDQSGKQRSRCA